MKNFTILLIAAILPFLTACPVKTKPRVEHEAAKTWKPQDTPEDATVEAKSFHAFDLKGAYSALQDDSANLLETVLKPLSKFVLNGKFIEKADYRTQRMSTMIQIFNAALVKGLEKNDRSPEFLEIRNAYYSTVFAGCTRDLKDDCYNAELFSMDTRHTRIFTLLAREYDAQIEATMKTGSSQTCMKSPDCRNAVEDRYRMLGMAIYKRNRYDDRDFAFAYMKYARVFAVLIETLKTEEAKIPASRRNDISTSYLAESHAKIFETIIPRYQPRNIHDPEFRAFVENFNPWVYSNKKADIFQHGTKVMFEYGTRCCMYQDASKTELSKAVTEAILESQNETDVTGVPFSKMAEEVLAAGRLAKNLGIEDLALRAKNKDKSFLNEFFFLVDRMFRGHLSVNEVEMVLRNANIERVKTMLPKTIKDYVRIQMAYLVLKTNKYMAEKVYGEDKISSDEVFEYAINKSREESTRWLEAQNQIQELRKMMDSYFHQRGLSSPEFNETAGLIQAFNRNAHFLSVYPNMIAMTYFLSKMSGRIVVNTWWGDQITIEAGTILKDLFDGRPNNPWFHFAKDAEPANRLMLLYAWEYLMSTEAINGFDAKDSTTAGSSRPKFFDLIFNKYTDVEMGDLRKEILEFERTTYASPKSGLMQSLCNYEADGRSQVPSTEISFLDLGKYTYAGPDSPAFQLLGEFFYKAGNTASRITSQLNNRISFVKVMLDVLEADVTRSGHPSLPNKPNEETARARAILAELEALQLRTTKFFAQNQERYFNCAMSLMEVERRRNNRLYDEEREHLRKIHKLIVSVREIADPAKRAEKIASINATEFTREKGYRFDRISDQKYTMAKYDLYQRIGHNLVNDIFVRPTDAEKAVYGASLNKYNKPRLVTIIEPSAVERNDIVEQRPAEQIQFTADVEEFVRQGMKVFNGEPGSFVEWFKKPKNARDRLNQYISSMLDFYLLGPISDDQHHTYGITKEALLKAYIEVQGSLGMDKFDIENSKAFSADGYLGRSYFDGRLFEPDFQTRLPLFNDLMKTAYGSSLIASEATPTAEAISFAQQINNFKNFEESNIRTFIFSPTGEVSESIRRHYGKRTHETMKRVRDLFSAIKEKEDTDPATLHPGLARTMFLFGETEMKWYSSQSDRIMDKQKLEDVRTAIRNFGNKTDDFYKTRGEVTIP